MIKILANTPAEPILAKEYEGLNVPQDWITHNVVNGDRNYPTREWLISFLENGGRAKQVFEIPSEHYRRDPKLAAAWPIFCNYNNKAFKLGFIDQYADDKVCERSFARMALLEELGLTNPFSFVELGEMNDKALLFYIAPQIKTEELFNLMFYRFFFNKFTQRMKLGNLTYSKEWEGIGNIPNADFYNKKINGTVKYNYTIYQNQEYYMEVNLSLQQIKLTEIKTQNILFEGEYQEAKTPFGELVYIFSEGKYFGAKKYFSDNISQKHHWEGPQLLIADSLEGLLSSPSLSGLDLSEEISIEEIYSKVINLNSFGYSELQYLLDEEDIVNELTYPVIQESVMKKKFLVKGQKHFQERCLFGYWHLNFVGQVIPKPLF